MLCTPSCGSATRWSRSATRCPRYGLVAPDAEAPVSSFTDALLSRTPTRCTRGRSPPARREINPVADQSTATAPAPCATRSATAGRSPTHIEDMSEEELANQLDGGVRRDGSRRRRSRSRAGTPSRPTTARRWAAFVAHHGPQDVPGPGGERGEAARLASRLPRERARAGTLDGRAGTFVLQHGAGSAGQWGTSSRLRHRPGRPARHRDREHGRRARLHSRVSPPAARRPPSGPPVRDRGDRAPPSGRSR